MVACLVITEQMTFTHEYPRNTKSVVEVSPNLLTANLSSFNSPCILVLQELLFVFRADLHQDQNPIVRNLRFPELRFLKIQKAEGLLVFINQESGYISKKQNSERKSIMNISGKKLYWLSTEFLRFFSI